MKRWLVKNNFLKALTSFLTISILVVGASFYFLHNEAIIGPIYLLIALFSMSLLRIFGITLKEVSPDIVFGIIDNGVLIFTTLLGGLYAGVAGAVLGGAAGNTITDGLGGLVEGRVSQKVKRSSNLEDQRTPMSAMMGKVIGCLIGAGVGLFLVWIIRIIF